MSDFAHGARDTQCARHAVDFGERELEVALAGVLRSDSLLPLAEAVHLGAFLGGDRAAVGVLVLPVDLGGQALVVHRLRGRRAHAGLVLSFGVVERPPLRPAVDVFLLQNQPTLVTDEFPLAALDQVLGFALGTACGLLLSLLLAFETPLSLACRAFHYTFVDDPKVI
jgi:hypothetical protein